MSELMYGDDVTKNLGQSIRGHLQWLNKHTRHQIPDLDLFESKVESVVSSFLLLNRGMRTTISEIARNIQVVHQHLSSGEPGGLSLLVSIERSVVPKKAKALDRLKKYKEFLEDYFLEVDSLFINIRDAISQQGKMHKRQKALTVCDSVAEKLDILGESVFRQLEDYPKTFEVVMRNIEELKAPLLHDETCCRSGRSKDASDVVQYYERQRSSSLYDD